MNQGRKPSLSFWRDSNKNEIDLVIEKGPMPIRAVEVKSSETYRSKYFDVMSRIAPEALGLSADSCSVVYGGDEAISTPAGKLVPFRAIGDML